MDLKEIQSLIGMCKAGGVKKICLSGVEIEFGSSGPVVQDPKQKIGLAVGMPTEDEMLFYSAPDLPNIEAYPP